MPTQADVGFWHFSDMAFVLDDVCSWGRSGNYLLFPSISLFDPKRAFHADTRNAREYLRPHLYQPAVGGYPRLMRHVELFLSTVSDEFRSYRDSLGNKLKRPNVDIHVQEDFIATGTETLDKLDGCRYAGGLAAQSRGTQPCVGADT
jgi:hypothetical protein